MKPDPRHVVEERWRQYRLARIDKSRRKHENRIKNMGLVLRLDDGRSLEFRGRHYGVPPVPWWAAARILQAQRDLEALNSKKLPPAEALAETHRIFSEITDVAKDVVRPSWRMAKDSRFRRWLWNKLPNPFADLPPAEVGNLLGFFSKFLEMDAVETLTSPAVRLGTSPSTSPASSLISPRGAKTDGRGPGRRS